jgi:hypothetical protein
VFCLILFGSIYFESFFCLSFRSLWVFHWFLLYIVYCLPHKADTRFRQEIVHQLWIDFSVAPKWVETPNNPFHLRIQTDWTPESLSLYEQKTLDEIHKLSNIKHNDESCLHYSAICAAENYRKSIVKTVMYISQNVRTVQWHVLDQRVGFSM